ncbi:MAG: hypothetical protein H7X95_00380 [Deltaproteobacteria bacterium]|nr:hypothetical protein [Deltaproteobacteria bacterium]
MFKKTINLLKSYRDLRRTFGGASFTALTVAAGLLCGCAEGVVPTVDCTTVTPVKYSELTIWPTCTGCHASALSGGARHDAPGGFNYDTYASSKAQAVPAAAWVNAGLMPPGNSPQPTAEEKTALYNWALCGTPN